MCFAGRTVPLSYSVYCLQGLEVEVQRLITRHRAELASSLDKAAEQAKQAAEQAKAQHEAHVAALKERLRQVGGRVR